MKKIGFLPLYLELYDQCSPADGIAARKFGKHVAAMLAGQGFDVVESTACRTENEFRNAVKLFETSNCQAIVTLHLAYSPSLEAAGALAASALPLIILDTTPDMSFSDPDRQVMANHGIHGVQDLGNLLCRYRKKFLIAAGACDEKLFKRVSTLINGAVMSHKMRNLRIGRVGGIFKGMGDFCFSSKALEITEVPWYESLIVPSEKEIDREIAADYSKYRILNLPENVHRQSVSDCLRIRRWVEAEKLDGFTICYGGMTRQTGWKTVPFAECSKSMARGLGYAGEGDTLTSGLLAALFAVYKECSFSEMFCPDWANDRIFVSHMGEINPEVTTDPLLTSIEYIFGDSGDPAVIYGCFKPGNALWIDLAPQADDRLKLIVAPVKMLEAPPGTRDIARNTGWFCPRQCTSAELLENYTRHGGTHHSVLSYDADVETLRSFAVFMNWDFAVI